jgi:hypothetical protein
MNLKLSLFYATSFHAIYRSAYYHVKSTQREREREREICVAELSITDQTLISPVEHIPDPYCILDSILFPRLKSYYICTSCKLDEI